tara:strand:- start:2134 stop:3462 length:1329 start_codon:yes stop_codon:yes gene_type:complete
MKSTIAIVGSGPGGMYAAQGLLDKDPDCRVDIVERLPSPFGLIRGGVAPDHQKTKKVSKAYERTLANPRVRYFGNVEVGRNVSIPELMELYNVVILAYGAPHDNQLGIPGEHLSNVYGSNAFVGWYNGHPDFKDLNPDLEIISAALIGVGNVALDVARVLAKTNKEMSVTDLVSYAASACQNSPIKEIHMLGRRGPTEAAFTNVELREMGELENAFPVISPDHLPNDVVAEYMSERDLRLRKKNVETMRSFLEVSPTGKNKKIHFGFYLSPVEFIGTDRITAIKCERTRVDSSGKVHSIGEAVTIPCQLAITCIGSRAFPIDGIPFNEQVGIVQNIDGKIYDRLYAVGWLKRGASGTIGTNKNDSLEVVDRILKEIDEVERRGSQALDEILEKRKVRVVSFEEWKIIDQLEVKEADPGAPRKKLITPADMIAALDASQQISP